MPELSSSSPAPQTTVESQQKNWTIVSWCHKVADSVSSKFEVGSTAGKWLGRAVATVFVPFGVIPALMGDAIDGFKSLCDRHVEKKDGIDNKIPTKAEFEALQREYETLSNYFEELAQKTKMLKEANTDLHERVATAEKDLHLAERRCDQYKNQAKDQLEVGVRNAHGDQAELKEQHRQEINKKDERIKALESELSRTNVNLQSKLEKLKEKVHEKTNLENKVEELQVEIKNIKSINFNLDSENQRLKIKAVDADKTIRSLQARLQAEESKSTQDKHPESSSLPKVDESMNLRGKQDGEQVVDIANAETVLNTSPLTKN